MLPGCFRDHPITKAFIVLLSAASGARLLTSGRALAPRLSDQGSLLFFLRESRLIQSSTLIPQSCPQMFGKGVLALKRPPNDGSHPKDIAGGWCAFKMDHRYWCFIGQKPVSLQGFHRRSQMSNFFRGRTSSKKLFLEISFPNFNTFHP